jgi:hypothetical protein
MRQTVTGTNGSPSPAGLPFVQPNSGSGPAASQWNAAEGCCASKAALCTTNVYRIMCRLCLQRANRTALAARASPGESWQARVACSASTASSSAPCQTPALSASLGSPVAGPSAA